MTWTGGRWEVPSWQPGSQSAYLFLGTDVKDLPGDIPCSFPFGSSPSLPEHYPVSVLLKPVQLIGTFPLELLCCTLQRLQVCWWPGLWWHPSFWRQEGQRYFCRHASVMKDSRHHPRVGGCYRQMENSGMQYFSRLGLFSPACYENVISPWHQNVANFLTYVENTNLHLKLSSGLGVVWDFKHSCGHWKKFLLERSKGQGFPILTQELQAQLTGSYLVNISKQAGAATGGISVRTRLGKERG